MTYIVSTKNPQLKISLSEAIVRGLPPDGGLYLPVDLPRRERSFFSGLQGRSFSEICTAIAQELLPAELSGRIIADICRDSFNFPVPLVRVTDKIQALELFHGPTLAFKDFGARFMARLLRHFLPQQNGDVVVLVATSGDTGSAVAHGFYRVPGIRVVILYPKSRVSKIQEQQLTTLGENISALEVEGSFDDCQRLVKQAFLDKDLCSTLTLTSANSINIARLIPQSFYYVHAWLQAGCPEDLVFSVPSGNFGNLTGGLLARQLGLPVQRFIAATNSNDTFPLFLQSGTYQAKPSVATLSNAMDVGDPSNFARIDFLFDKSVEKTRTVISADVVSDTETKDTIRRVYQDSGYLLDPHGAVAFRALEKTKSAHGIFLATAHPAKFKESVEESSGATVEIPERLGICMHKEKQSIAIANSFEQLKMFLCREE